jgi:hypothetical protein
MTSAVAFLALGLLRFDFDFDLDFLAGMVVLTSEGN